MAWALNSVASDEHVSAPVTGFVDKTFNIVNGFLFNQSRNLYTVFNARTNLHCLNALYETLAEFISNIFMHNNTVCCGASLADIAELRRENSFNSFIEVCVIEHDQWRIAAEFHRRAQDVLCCGFHELDTNRG